MAFSTGNQPLSVVNSPPWVRCLACPAVLLGVNWLSPTDLISTFGTIGLLAIIFVESGLFPAPLPGDSLLVLAGAFAATKEHGQPHMNLAVVTIGAFVVAVVGAEIGYWIGRKYGVRLFKPDARVFKTEYHDRAQDFFERRGAPSVVLARFVPIVRTIVPMVAGTTGMEHRKFSVANVIGAALWAVGITMLGFWIGKSIKIDRYIYPIVALIIIVSLIPPFLEYRKHKKAKSAT